MLIPPTLQAYFEKNERLEAKFRPEDQFCKPAVARANKTSNLVLKVKRKRRLKVSEGGASWGGRENGEDMLGGGDQPALGEASRSEGEGGKEEYDYSAELLGVVNTTFQFQGTHTCTCVYI